MKHALRKYLAPCGSALFMVVSTMAALVVLVTAMYMSVVSSGKVQYATFNQEQAYISSTSIGDMIASAIPKNKALNAKLSTLKVGEKYSTDGNGFAAFGGTNEESDVGAYTVDITRLNNETVNGEEAFVYDMAVTVSKNGVVETTHMFMTSTPDKPQEMERISRFFTNTGYLPNDVWISSVTTDSTVHCDNEYTIFSKDINTDKFGGGGDVIFNMDVTCAGAALMDASAQFKNVTKPLTWVIGNNLTIGNNTTLNKWEMGGTSSEHAKLIVGGDLILNSDMKTPAYTDVYVLGNLYINPVCYPDFQGALYVHKDIIFTGTNCRTSISNLYIDGTVRAIPGGAVTTNKLVNNGVWGDSEAIEDELNSRIGGSVYPNWRINTADFDTVDIIFNTDDNNAKGSAKYIHYINEDCTIGKVKDLYAGSGSSVNLTIVIDTGDDPLGERHLQVSANCDDIGVDDTFMWYPEASPSGGKTISVITVGQGTLAIDVPDGVTYQASDQEFFGHIAWFVMAGGKMGKTIHGVPYFDRAGFNLVTMADTISNNNLILQTPDGTCNYTEVTKKDSDGKDYTYYTCDSHGGSYSESDVKDFEDGKEETLCIGRILRDEVDSYFSKHTDQYNQMAKYYEEYFGDTYTNSNYSLDSYYPNVNIFVVSVLENADIQFGVKKATDESVQNNVFFGYVYAPYMTFVAVGSGGGLKNVGGLVVSDMAVNGAYKYIFAQPDRTIQQIVGDGFDALRPSGSRTWRIHGT